MWNNGLVPNWEGICQGCILLPCLFNFYAKYIMLNTRLDESQDGIKTSGRNINNVGYADHTTLIAESEEEFWSLLIRMKEERTIREDQKEELDHKED